MAPRIAAVKASKSMQRRTCQGRSGPRRATCGRRCNKAPCDHLLTPYSVPHGPQDGDTLRESVDESERALEAAVASHSWYAAAIQANMKAGAIAGGLHSAPGAPFHVPTARAMLERAAEYEGRCREWLPPSLREQLAESRKGNKEVLAAALQEHRAAKRALAGMGTRWAGQGTAGQGNRCKRA
jgi:hypothetical protein